MLLNSLRSRFYFAIKKPISQPGIIVDPQYFRNNSISDKILHWWRNTQTLNDMQRHLSDFNRKRCNSFFINHNNNLLNVIEKRNLRDLQTIINDNLYKQIKVFIKNNEKLPESYNLFQCSQAKIVQARSYMDSIVRLKSIDQWYQLTLQYTNSQQNRKAYHVLERFYKQKQWRFIKFNL